MQSLRTPDEGFEALKDHAFAPTYLEVEDIEGVRLRIHHLDEGPRDTFPLGRCC